MSIKIIVGSQKIAWNECNGILIAGRSGSGKSQTASLIIGQLAYQGVKLIPCDFESPVGEPEALAERISFCADAFLYPIATRSEDILQRIELLKDEYEKRLVDPSRREPWLLIIDEFSAFLSYLKSSENGDEAIASFSRLLIQMRKLQMRALVIGQEFSSGFATNAMRYIRSAFAVRLLHKLDGPNIKMILEGADTKVMRIIGNLSAGQVWFNEEIHLIPLLDQEAKDIIEGRLSEQVFDSETWLANMFAKYGQVAGYNLDITDRQTLVNFWKTRGYSQEQIDTYLVPRKDQ
jgi:hypothetical protein